MSEVAYKELSSKVQFKQLPLGKWRPSWPFLIVFMIHVSIIESSLDIFSAVVWLVGALYYAERYITQRNTRLAIYDIREFLEGKFTLFQKFLTAILVVLISLVVDWFKEMIPQEFFLPVLYLVILLSVIRSEHKFLKKYQFRFVREFVK